MDEYRHRFVPRVEGFKVKHLDRHDRDDPVILHREDIKERRGVFHVLRDEARRSSFDSDLLALIGESVYTILTVVIDKWSFGARCGKDADPYRRCLWELLEHYCQFLGEVGELGDVMGEARQQHLDEGLRDAYRKFIETHPPGSVLSSKELKLKPKDANVLGIQMADLLAYPTKQEVLVRIAHYPGPLGYFTAQVCDRVRDKLLLTGLGILES